MMTYLLTYLLEELLHEQAQHWTTTAAAAEEEQQPQQKKKKKKSNNNNNNNSNKTTRKQQDWSRQGGYIKAYTCFSHPWLRISLCSQLSHFMSSFSVLLVCAFSADDWIKVGILGTSTVTTALIGTNG